MGVAVGWGSLWGGGRCRVGYICSGGRCGVEVAVGWDTYAVWVAVGWRSLWGGGHCGVGVAVGWGLL